MAFINYFRLEWGDTLRHNIIFDVLLLVWLNLFRHRHIGGQTSTSVSAYCVWKFFTFVMVSRPLRNIYFAARHFFHRMYLISLHLFLTIIWPPAIEYRVFPCYYLFFSLFPGIKVTTNKYIFLLIVVIKKEK